MSWQWLLCLFSEYRAQTALVQSLTSDKLILQDRLDSAMNDRAELWRMMEKSIDSERETLRTYAVRSPKDQAQDTPMEQLSRRQMPSEMIASSTQKFLHELRSRHAMKSGPVEEFKD